MAHLFTNRKKVELKINFNILQIVDFYCGYLKDPNNGIKKCVNSYILINGYFDATFSIGTDITSEIEIVYLLRQNHRSSSSNYICVF